MQTKYFVVDHGRSWAFIPKKLFVSKTYYKLSSRTLTWEVKNASCLCLSIVQNQNTLQQIPGKKKPAEKKAKN